MAIEKVRAYFETLGIADRIMEFDTSSATVELAALAAGCEPARIAKTLSFMVEGKPVLVVAAGDAKVDNRKYKDMFHTKAKMLTPEEAETLVGHAVGGVCPFAVNEGVAVYLDESLRRFSSVFPACGSSTALWSFLLRSLSGILPAFPCGATSARAGRRRTDGFHYLHMFIKRGKPFHGFPSPCMKKTTR